MRSLLLAALALGASTSSFAAEPAPPESWNVLVIVLDAQRADRMGLYGHDRDTTPYLERLATESVVFEQCFSVSAWTSPGVVSAFTGLGPLVHGQTTRYDYVDDTLVTPLDVLRGRGVQPIARETDGPTVRGVGFRQGYLPVLRHGPEVVEWLASRSGRWAAWVHIKGTHLPYDPPAYHLRRFGGDRLDTPAIRAVRENGTVYPQDYGLSWNPPVIASFTAEEQAVIRDLYDGDVAAQDDEIGRMVEHLRERGVLDRTLLVITADHGEELFEHGWVGHASTGYQGKLTDELLHIPLLVRVPGGTLAGRSDALVQQSDIMPTVFDLLGVPEEGLDAPFQGRSLVPLMRGEGQGSEHVFAVTTKKGWTTPLDETRDGSIMVRTADRKLIRTREGDAVTVQAFDLVADPGEQVDLWPTEPDRFADLGAALDAWIDESREEAARLLFLVGERRVAAMKDAAREGDAVEAARQWAALAELERTYRTEWASPFDNRETVDKWARLRNRGMKHMGRASR